MIILDKLYTWIMNHFLTDEDFDPNTEYSPANYEDGKLKPAENK